MTARRRATVRKQPTQERARETVKAILAAATQLFVNDGFASATTARIAERAGVSVGSLYQYYPNKESLLVALGRRHIAQGHQRFEAVLNQESLDGLGLVELMRVMVHAMLELHLAEPALHRVLMHEVPPQALITKAKEESERALLLQLERVLARQAEVRAKALRLSVALVARTVESLTHWYVIEAPMPRIEREAFVDEVVTMVCGYLRA